MKNTFYITTPIYYPNAKPHIGTLYSTVLADIFARFYKLRNNKVVFLTGLDQHGQKVASSAAQHNKSCEEFVHEITKIYKHIFSLWNIEYDVFMETTAPYHKETVIKWIQKLQDKGYIYKDTYQGWYSPSQEQFLQDRDIQERDADGTPLCPITKQKAQWLSQESYFFALSKFEDKLLDFFDTHPDFIVQTERIEEVISFIKQGLKDLCLSRLKKDVSWGIPFPNDPNHVVYVWADALNNYLSGVGYLQNDKQEEFEASWPCDLHIMAKDIIRFHTIYWLAFLMAADLPLPKREFVHGWLLCNNQKMSKTLGNIIDPQEILHKYHPDVLRYYFSTLSTKDDVDFDFAILDQKYTSDLCDNISNLIQRMNALCIKNNIDNLIFKKNNYTEQLETTLIQTTHYIENQIVHELDNYQLLKINNLIVQYSSSINAYFQAKKPWQITYLEDLKNILAITSYCLYNISIWLSPIMPQKMNEMRKLLGLENTNLISFNALAQLEEVSFRVTKINQYLFDKKNINAEDQVSDTTKVQHTEENTIASNTISFEEFRKNIILVGLIKHVEDIPKSNKLYYLTVDFGTIYGIKKIASGIKAHYTPEEVSNRKTIFCYNLEPRNLCGMKSEGMILMTTDDKDKPHFINISQEIPLGTRLS
jgi:methionyl-tRNA synthetase